MRKLDILMLKSYMGSFVLTTAVANFILLIQYLLKYFDDFVGKNLGIAVFAELLFYFSLNMLQAALPLGVLISSLMTFGNLGENLELTAIKSSGISLLRTLRPIFLFVVVLSIGAFFFNNYTIPLANLKAYSLLYNIKHTKPALDISAGAFYGGIPNFSIKVKEKMPDGKTLKDVIIYDHTGGKGNKTLILADSSLMYTIMDDRYLKLELYKGNYYIEQKKPKSSIDQFYRTNYYRMDLVFSLSSFDLKRRKEELFQNNRQMKNISELTHDIDSFVMISNEAKMSLIKNSAHFFDFHLKTKEEILKRSNQGTKDGGNKGIEDMEKPFFKIEEPPDTSNIMKEKVLSASFFSSLVFFQKLLPGQLSKRKDDQQELLPVTTNEDDKDIRRANRDKVPYGLRPHDRNLVLDSLGWGFLDTRIKRRNRGLGIYTTAANQARNIKVNVQSTQNRVKSAQKERNLYIIEKYKKYAQSLACLLMFLIGAPLGSIIKKGGLGVPTIIAIIFYIIYYVFTSIGEKSAKEGVMNSYFSVWLPDMVLLPFGLFFLRQAKIDARLLDLDFYYIWIDKIKTRFAKK